MAEEHRIKLTEGIVVKIVPFGAFVKTDTNEVGLVHISEISDTYVKDVNQFLKEGDKVIVRVIGRNKDGKLNLSIKAAKAAGGAEGTPAVPAAAVPLAPPAALAALMDRLSLPSLLRPMTRTMTLS